MKKVYCLLYGLGNFLTFENEKLREEYSSKIIGEDKIIIKSEFNVIENEKDLNTALDDNIIKSIKNKLNSEEIEYLKNNNLGDD